MRRLILPSALAVGVAIAAGVAPVTGKTLGENPAASDVFGASWSQPGPIAIGLASITRAATPEKREGLVVFPNLRNHQQLTLNISALLGIDIAYSKGGPTLCSTSAVLWRTGVESAATFFRGYWRPNAKLGMKLQVTSRGSITLTFDIGKRPVPQLVQFQPQLYRPIVLTASPPAAVVPLPLPIAALASGLGALLMLKRRRRRAS